jgi:transposase
MIKPVFKEDDIDSLYDQALGSGQWNAWQRRRSLVVYLRSLKYPNEDIRKICRVTQPTIAKCMKEYCDNGIEQLTVSGNKGRESALNQHREDIKKMFADTPPATLKQARQMITDRVGITVSVTQVWYFLKKIGMSIKKVGGVPGKANVEEQESFKKKIRA